MIEEGVSWKLSEESEFVVDVETDDNGVMGWINQRLVKTKSGLEFALTDEEVSKLFRILY